MQSITSVKRFLSGAGRSRLPASVAGFMAARRRKLGWRGTPTRSPLSAMVTLPVLPSSRPATRSNAYSPHNTARSAPCLLTQDSRVHLLSLVQQCVMSLGGAGLCRRSTTTARQTAYSMRSHVVQRFPPWGGQVSQHGCSSSEMVIYASCLILSSACLSQ